MYRCEYAKQTLYLYYYISIIVLFSIQATVNLRFPHPEWLDFYGSHVQSLRMLAPKSECYGVMPGTVTICDLGQVAESSDLSLLSAEGRVTMPVCTELMQGTPEMHRGQEHHPHISPECQPCPRKGHSPPSCVIEEATEVPGDQFAQGHCATQTQTFWLTTVHQPEPLSSLKFTHILGDPGHSV